jgi:SAM-dependent methyltransferase
MRPDTAAWLTEQPTGSVLVVDGGAGDARASFPGAQVVVHAPTETVGLPFSERDPRRLTAATGAFGAVVLHDVLDAVLDVTPALEEARRVLASGGLLLVVQNVAPDDHAERALWNALARLRDPSRVWTPSAKQLAAVAQGFRMSLVREAQWKELLELPRPNGSPPPALLLAESARILGSGMIQDGALVATRRAALHRRD